MSLASKIPLTMGVEAAGIVEKLGAKVGSVAVGDRVAFMVGGSGELNRYRDVCHASLQAGLLVWVGRYRGQWQLSSNREFD